jgi:metal-responsive CopG/Arc/MetJ family transcriptional regulator
MKSGSHIAKTIRLTISVPTALLEEVDRNLDGTENRSAFVRRLMEDALKAAEEQRKVEQYIRGYTENPQTEEEWGWQDQVAVQALREVPWD